MILRRMIAINKVVIPTLIFSILVGCSSSKQVVSKLSEPSIEERDINKWYLYYQQELKIGQGKIVAPNDSYPTEAKDGYTKALSEWRNETTLYIVGIVVLVPIIVWGISRILPTVSPGRISFN
jgi:hypothetical protein